MGVGSDKYVFRSVWRLPADPQLVYDTLMDVSTYPLWWHQVRSARQLDAVSGELRCRSLLPYDLSFVITRELEDPVNRLLRAHMNGDLNGTSQWTITPDDNGGAVAVFDEDVTVGNSMVRAAGRLARPALRFNHDLMMRSGEHGLRKHLAADRTPGG